MQEAAFAAAGLNWRYITLRVAAADLPAAVAGLRAMNFQGINLTIPHKVAILSLLDEVAPDAALIGAVNTVRRAGDRLIGENTDGKGFLRSIRDDAGIDPAGKRVVFLGAGGAARAMTVELALAGCAAHHSGQPLGCPRRGARPAVERSDAGPRRVCAVGRRLRRAGRRRHPGQRHVHRALPRCDRHADASRSTRSGPGCWCAT